MINLKISENVLIIIKQQQDDSNQTKQYFQCKRCFWIEDIFGSLKN